MTRILLVLLCVSLMGGCSVSDLRQMAEGIRIQAEGVGAQAELRHQNERMNAAGEGGYGTARVWAAPEPESEKKDVTPPKEEKKAPPPPVYVVVPAF